VRAYRGCTKKYWQKAQELGYLPGNGQGGVHCAGLKQKEGPKC